MRYFNSLYANIKLDEKISVITGFDFGVEQASFQSNKYNEWFAPVIITRYDYNHHWGFAIRGEYFQDAYGTIIPVQSNASEFKTTPFRSMLTFVHHRMQRCGLRGVICPPLKMCYKHQRVYRIITSS